MCRFVRIEKLFLRALLNSPSVEVTLVMFILCEITLLSFFSNLHLILVSLRIFVFQNVNLVNHILFHFVEGCLSAASNQTWHI